MTTEITYYVKKEHVTQFTKVSEMMTWKLVLPIILLSALQGLYIILVVLGSIRSDYISLLISLVFGSVNIFYLIRNLNLINSLVKMHMVLVDCNVEIKIIEER